MLIMGQLKEKLAYIAIVIVVGAAAAFGLSLAVLTGRLNDESGSFGQTPASNPDLFGDPDWTTIDVRYGD
jgi:hypothetical protein